MWNTFWSFLRSSPSQEANEPDPDTLFSLSKPRIQIDRTALECDIVIEDLEEHA